MIGAKRKPIPVKQASIPLKSLLLIAFLLGSSTVFGQNGSLDIPQIEHISIAPISIPVGPSGTTDIGMTRFGCRTANNGDTTSLSSIRLQATSDGTFSNTWISGIRVYFEVEGAVGEYDHGATVDDVRADTGAALVWFGAGNDTVDIALNPSVVTITRPGGGLNYLYVVVDLTSSADTTTTLGFEVIRVTYGTVGSGGTGSTVAAPANYSLHATTENLDNYEMTMNATWIGPASAAANASKVGLLQLDFDTVDSSAIGYIDTIQVNRTFGQDNYVATAGVLLYEDADDDGNFEPDTDDGAYIVSATLSSGSATLDPANPSEPPDPRFLVTQAGHTYFIAVNMDGLTAQPGQDFGINIDNPSTDIIYADEIEDDNVLVATEYAYVPFDASGLYEYVQVGYITSTTADPAAILANTLYIEQADDGQPPSVVTTVPDTGVTGVDRNANLIVIFSEWMTEATVTNTANFELTDGVTPVTVGLSYDQPTQTLTVNPSTTLDWGTLYTATVKFTMEDYYNNPMGSSAADDYSWTFTTEPETLPYVSSQSPAVGEIDIAVNTTVQVTFSEDMDTTTYAANFELRDSGNNLVTGEVTASGLRNLIFTPGSVASPVDLNNDETYTVWVRAGVADLEGSTKGSDESWTFTTIRLYPPFDEPIAIKNRIGTGANSEALIFVPQPPGGASERVSVQVFTTTGKLVRTFYKNVPWTTIGAGPISWDGTNDRGQDLGPGMYFVQIRTPSYKRVLKVMIVR